MELMLIEVKPSLLAWIKEVAMAPGYTNPHVEVAAEDYIDEGHGWETIEDPESAMNAEDKPEQEGKVAMQSKLSRRMEAPARQPRKNTTSPADLGEQDARLVADAAQHLASKTMAGSDTRGKDASQVRCRGRSLPCV